MLLSTILFFLTLTVGSVFSAPTQDGLIRAELMDRTADTDSCGMITFSGGIGTPILKDATCHTWPNVNQPRGDMKNYNILNGCTCFFYYNNGCNGNFVGWKGPNRGSTSRTGLVAYYCRQSTQNDRRADLDDESELLMPVDAGIDTTDLDDGAFTGSA